MQLNKKRTAEKPLSVNAKTVNQQHKDIRQFEDSPLFYGIDGVIHVIYIKGAEIIQ